MLQIITSKGVLNMPSGFTLDIEDTNPIFNDVGSQSLPATVPATGINRRLLGFPELLTVNRHPNQPEQHVGVACGSYIRSGTLNITSAGRRSGISFNIGFDNSTAYAKWQGKKLADLSGLPELRPDGDDPVDDILKQLRNLYYMESETDNDPLAVFPMVVAKKQASSDDAGSTVWEVVNSSTALEGRFGLRPVVRLVDDKLTEVTVPNGYGVTPFLKVWRLLELVFADLGLEITENPFLTDTDLRRLVVLNNSVDGVATGVLRYAELVPDCTVSELLNALWVRFGLVYTVDSDRRTVTLRLVRDIMRAGAAVSMEQYVAGDEVITFNAPQYLKLSAQTSFDGAEPPCERYEDFVNNLSDRAIVEGNNIEQWLARDLVLESVGNATEIIGHEVRTGRWVRLDTVNKIFKKSGSSFFDWNPQPDGYEALELSSTDECVPVVWVSTQYQDEHTQFGQHVQEFCPAYLAGSRHRHSILKGSANADSAEESEETTPLAFIFAYKLANNLRTVGRVSAAGEMVVGPEPKTTLYFQFKDGLFANFWREYDECLRHGNRLAEVDLRMSTHAVRSFDFLRPVMFRNVRCLVDTLSYSLPATGRAAVSAKLRVMQTMGNYDIEVERPIPAVASITGHYEWQAIDSDIEDVIQNITANEVLQGWQDLPYRSDWQDAAGVWHIIREQSVRFVAATCGWQDAAPDREPGAMEVVSKELPLFVHFDIYEILTTNPDFPEPYTFSDNPVANRQTVQKPCLVKYASRWVAD